MPKILRLDSLEILDSRGRPTIEATCWLASGARATAQVPSGASTGSSEARELRDGDPARHAGMGCLRAVANVRGEIQARLKNATVASQAELDGALVRLDGTPDKSRLGANAILSVSLAFARAVASERDLSLVAHFALEAGCQPSSMPRPTVNLFSGGKHAGGQVAIQDVLLVPSKATTVSEALSQVCAVYRAASELVACKYNARALVADEGGLAPPFTSAESMIDDAVTSISAAGYAPGRDFSLAIDVAASHFHHNGRYALDGAQYDNPGMIDLLERWVDEFPIISIEDGLAEDAWVDWSHLQRRLGGRIRLLGDDLLCTNPGRIERAVGMKSANALLLKVNQVGTVSEAMAAMRLARAAGWGVTVSARSGETEDNWLADLATGWEGDEIKIGSVTRSERLAKYNRLLAIEAETGWRLAQQELR